MMAQIATLANADDNDINVFRRRSDKDTGANPSTGVYFALLMAHHIAEPIITRFVCNSFQRALPKSQLSTISSTSGNMSSSVHFFWQKRAA